MPRPKKKELDYFPLETVFDEKIQLLESLFGNEGFTWIIKFWQKAYRNENGEVYLSKYFGEIMAKNCRCTPEVQQKIIDFCLEINLIKETAPQVYTSNGIQKRIAAVSHDREEALKRYFKNKESTKEIKTKKIRGKIQESRVKDFGDTSAKYIETVIPIHLKEPFMGFEEMRRSIKKPITEYAKKKIIEKLESFYPGNFEKQIECLNQSTMNCWQGVFKIKDEDRAKPKYGYQPVSKEEIRAQMERIHLT